MHLGCIWNAVSVGNELFNFDIFDMFFAIQLFCLASRDT